jgi:hypothetical protein
MMKHEKYRIVAPMLACVDCDVIIIMHQELQQSSFFFILHFSCRSCVVEDVVVNASKYFACMVHLPRRQLDRAWPKFCENKTWSLLNC